MVHINQIFTLLLHFTFLLHGTSWYVMVYEPPQMGVGKTAGSGYKWLLSVNKTGWGV